MYKLISIQRIVSHRRISFKHRNHRGEDYKGRRNDPMSHSYPTTHHQHPRSQEYHQFSRRTAEPTPRIDATQCDNAIASKLTNIFRGTNPNTRIVEFEGNNDVTTDWLAKIR